MTDPIRTAAEWLLQQLDQRRTGLCVPLLLEQAEDDLRSALAAPTPEPDTDAVLKLAAIIREVDGSHSLGAAALAEAILAHPAAGEVFVAPTPSADGEAEIPEEVRAAFAELERRQESLRGFRQLRADLATATLTPPVDGEVGELATLLAVGSHCAAGARLSPEQCRRAAALLRQLPPEGLVAMEYFHTDSGARVVHEPRDGEPGWCWTVRNHRRFNPCTEFPTVAAAWEALQRARRQESDD